MNKHQAEALMTRIRDRVQALHTGPKGVQKGFRAEATDTGTKVYLYDAIGGWDGVLAKDVITTIAGLGDFDLHVNSPGGDIFEGVAIHNAIKNHPGKVTAHVDAVAASAASFIVMAADEVIIEANASMMVHDGWGLCIGNAADMRETADLLDTLSNTIAAMYATKTGKSTEDWRAVMAQDTWYTATEAVEAGLADRIAGDTSEASASFDLSVFDILGTRAQTQAAPVAAATTKTDPETKVEGFAQLLKEALA